MWMREGSTCLALAGRHKEGVRGVGGVMQMQEGSTHLALAGGHKREHMWGGGGDADMRGVNPSCVGRWAQMRGAVNINMYMREVDTLGIGMHKQGCKHRRACERS